MLDTLRNFFKGRKSVEATGDKPTYAVGFFRARGASGTIVLGFYSGAPANVTYIPCGPTVLVGSKRITLQVPEGKTLEEVKAALPLYQLPYQAQVPGEHRIGNTRLIDTDAMGWDGETGWDGAPPTGIPAGMK